MTELGRDYDRAEVLDTLGDVHAAEDRACWPVLPAAMEIYENGGYLLTAATTQHKLSLLHVT